MILLARINIRLSHVVSNSPWHRECITVPSEVKMVCYLLITWYFRSLLNWPITAHTCWLAYTHTLRTTYKSAVVQPLVICGVTPSPSMWPLLQKVSAISVVTVEGSLINTMFSPLGWKSEGITFHLHFAALFKKNTFLSVYIDILWYIVTVHGKCVFDFTIQGPKHGQLSQFTYVTWSLWLCGARWRHVPLLV